MKKVYKALNHDLNILLSYMVDILLENVGLVVILKLYQVLVIQFAVELLVFPNILGGAESWGLASVQILIKGLVISVFEV